MRANFIRPGLVVIAMAIVSSYGALTAIASPTQALSTVGVSGQFYDGYRRTYGEIYRRQPAVRTVVDFFSRNIAQLGLQVFERRDQNDRVQLFDHPLARLIRRPNPSTSRYRFIENTVQDIGIYANGYWLKVRSAGGFGLVRMPSAQMRVAGGLLPTAYVWQPHTAAPQTFAPSEIVHFRLFDPENALVGFPPLETLRGILAEEAAAADYRKYFWKNAARTENVITRPPVPTAPKWTPEQRESFRAEWQQFAGQKAGMTPILEDGMTLTPVGFNARDSQYIESRKLSREEVAAAYHVPLPMVGILDHATFSNIREQHKQLYQDCLGPWLTMLQEDIELQLLPEFDDPDRVYVEFNINAKMSGSFEEQADSLNKAVGRPWMTVNEARGRLNMPRDTDPASDKIAEVAPGQASSMATKPPMNAQAFRSVVSAHFARQRARVEKDPIEARGSRFNHVRWASELASDIQRECGVGFESASGEDAAHVAKIITNETWGFLDDGLDDPWSAARVGAIVTRFTEALA
jgi:HK97 family phage portal protein